MAKAKTTKPKVSADEKFTDVDFPLFPAIEALDRKDYEYFDNLTEEQRKKFTAFMLTHWMSTVTSGSAVQRQYLARTNEHANKYILDSSLKDHDKLQWLMLCTISPGKGKQYHKYIPHIKESVTLLRTKATVKEISDYYKKVYPNVTDDLLAEVSEEYVKQQKQKYYLAEQFPDLKLSDIEVLNDLLTEEEIKQYEKDRGN
jgi:hypothetical protein